MEAAQRAIGRTQRLDIQFNPVKPAVAGAVPPEHLGVATATKNLVNQVVTAFGIALLAGLYAGGAGFQPAFFAGGVMALLLRVQLAVPDNDFLSAAEYNAMFTMHATTMIFLFVMPMAAAFADKVVFLADGICIDEMADPTADEILDHMKTLGD